MEALQRENADLGKRVEELSARVDSLAARLARLPPAEKEPSAGPAGRAPAGAPAAGAGDAAALVPPNLAVVKMEPPRRPAREAHRARRELPPLSTAVAIAEPDASTVASLAAHRGDFEAEAQEALEAAHRQSGLAAARALEAFSAQYPRHPSADNALLEAAAARAQAGEADEACSLYARCVEEYPAGDAMPEALEQLGECHARRGQGERARQLLSRVVGDYPDTPAARRAQARLSALGAAAPPTVHP